MSTHQHSRYDEEWALAFWIEQWWEIVARCQGLSTDDPKWFRVRDHYLPAFDAAYQDRNAVLWEELLRNFNVGCPLPPAYVPSHPVWMIERLGPDVVQYRATYESIEPVPVRENTDERSLVEQIEIEWGA